MKAYGLLQNIGERAHIRTLLAKINPELPGSPETAARTLIEEGPFDVLMFDERFDEEKDLNSRRVSFSATEALDLYRAKFPQSKPWILIFLNESVSPDRVLQLSRKGADFFLLRPYGLKELSDKLSAVLRCLASPPKILATYHNEREQLLAGPNAKQVEFLRELHRFTEGDLPVSMLLAQVLLQDSEHSSEGIVVLRDMCVRFPESIATRAALVSALYRFGATAEAFEHTRELCRFAPNEKHFALALSLARAGTDLERLMLWSRDLAAAPGETAKRARVELLRELIDRSRSDEAIAQMLGVLKAYRDVKEEVAEGIVTLARTWMEKKDGAPAALHTASGLRLLEAAVDCDPGTQLIEPYVESKLAEQDFKSPTDVLERARRMKLFREEHYASAIRLALAERNLKSASDQLQLARRYAPSSERWEPLAQEWKSLYAATH